MSGSNWRRGYTIGLAIAAAFAAAIAGWLWFSTASLQADIEHHASEKARQYAHPSNISIEGECRRLPPADQPNCFTAEDQAAAEGERNERDLEAQQIMAAWTRAMGIAAIIGVGVGVFGLGLIFTTFSETRRAANAALEANLTTRMLIEPFITAEAGKCVVFCAGTHFNAYFPMTLTNRGTGVARSVTASGTLKIEGAEMPLYRQINDRNSGASLRQDGGNMHLSLCMEGIPPQYHDVVCGAAPINKEFTLTVMLTYLDAFGTKITQTTHYPGIVRANDDWKVALHGEPGETRRE